MSTDGSGVFAIVLAGGEGKRLAPLTADARSPRCRSAATTD